MFDGAVIVALAFRSITEWSGMRQVVAELGENVGRLMFHYNEHISSH